VRRTAAFGLALAREPWANSLLEQLRRDELWIVQSGAQTALETREGNVDGWKPIVPAELPWLIDWAAAKGRGVPGGDAAMTLLVDAISPAEPLPIRLAAMRVIGAVAALEGVPALQAVPPGDAPAARELAYETLCQISRAHGNWMGR